MAVEGVLADTAEVADARQGDRDKLIEEFVHALAAKGHFAADSLSFADFEGRDGFLGLGDDGVLTRDDREVINRVIQRFGILSGITNTHVDDDLFEARSHHDGGITEFLHESGTHFFFVFLLEAVDVFHVFFLHRGRLNGFLSSCHLAFPP